MRTSVLLNGLIAATMTATSAGDFGPMSGSGEKMRPEELVAKHLESIGTESARDAAGNRLMTGSAEANLRLGARGQLFGTAAMVSQARAYRLAMAFDSQQYTGEQMAFDGKKVATATVRSGIRSSLSSFVYRYDFLMREGLLGGATSVGWFLLDFKGRKPKLDYGGLKSLDGRKLHELKYRGGKGAGEFQVTFYFDPETFHHVLSLYVLKVPAFPVDMLPRLTSDQLEGSYRLREEFGDFRAADGLTLPHAYRLELTIEGQDRTFLADWKIDFTEVVHNQSLGADAFAVR